MKQISLNGTSRTETGKKAAKQFRQNGEVPCVIYGQEKGENGLPVAKSFTISYKELSKVIFTPHIYLIDLTIDGVDHKAILKEVQFHPVKDTILHVDFYEVHAEKPIVMAVPIATQGLAEGVRAGGRLTTQVRKLKVRALYEQIPEKLNIDVTSLGLGKTIKVGDLHFEGLELVTPKEVVVVAVKMTRAAMGAAAAAAKADK
ncbi:50S ribosomal protein L25 [Prevotella sp. CAG:755]|nr:50S ribosomal protein L25 [Prevotella sp. CAG:755]